MQWIVAHEANTQSDIVVPGIDVPSPAGMLSDSLMIM